MITKKVCLLGNSAVGKTSLVRRYVQGIFSEKYHSTIGVKIDKCSVKTADLDVSLVLWDVQGEDRVNKIMPNFVRGMSAYFLVVDVSSAASAKVGLDIHTRLRSMMAETPFILILSKCDLPKDQEGDAVIKTLMLSSSATFETSAKTGSGVENAFEGMARLTLGQAPDGTGVAC